jgi:cytochrome c
VLIAAALASASIAAVNHPPAVKIKSPKADAAYEPNAQVQYEIDVSDPDINPAEVLLSVRYFSSSAAAEAAIGSAIADDPPGLQTIRTSNCLGCHAFDARMSGPSLADIRGRYVYSQANVDTLSRRILDGATGIWGRSKMPSHPELTMAQAAACVTFILKTSADPQTNYYVGTAGSFRVSVPAEFEAKGQGMLVLVASYADHGPKDSIRIRIQ